MQITDKDIAEFKAICEKEGITYRSDDEYREAAYNLFNFVDLALDMSREQLGWQKRLENEPKGFSMAGEGRNCSLCGSGVNETDGWYDKWGFKCMNCQDAINKKKIPGSLCGDYKHEKCITDSTLAWKSGLHPQTIRKLIRHGKIKARKIPNGPYMILKKDNPNILNILEYEKSRTIS